jgi:putative DNA primase/helicase
MKAELRTYRPESDLIGEFLTDKTTADSESKVDQSHLYLKYRLWCDGSGLRPISKKSFTLRLAERGFAGSKSGASRFYDGLSLETA